MHEHSLETVYRGYFECAANDRVAANLLFDNAQYPLAIFHLQQYLEKLSKCYMLAFEKCYIHEVNKSHDILEILKKEQIRTGLLEKNQKMNLIEWAEELETIHSPNIEMFTKISEEFIDLGRKILPRIIGNITSEQLNETARYFGILTTLIVLTRKHETFTRYPAVNIDDKDYTDYNESSGIVHMFPFMIKQAKMIEDLLIIKMKTEFGFTSVPDDVA